MVLTHENKEIIEGTVEGDCAKLYSKFVESIDRTSRNEFKRHIETVVLIEITFIHTI